LFAFQAKRVSKNIFWLAFAAKLPWCLSKVAFKCTNEAGGMLVADCISNFFHTYIAFRQKTGGSLQPSFYEPTAQASSSALLEQVLKVRGAHIELERQVPDATKRPRFRRLDDPLQTLALRCA
jgi:hypothetical protein